METCVICNKAAVFKIKNEKIYYCENHAKEFFETDALENISKIKKSAKEAKILKQYLQSFK